MELMTVFGLFIISIILCWAGAEVVKRTSVTIQPRYLHAFHIIYGSLVLAAIVLL